MSYNWISAKEFSINNMLLMDRWMLQQFIGLKDSPMYEKSKEYREQLGVILAYNPTICWYFKAKCPEATSRIEKLVQEAPDKLSADEVREYEVSFIDTMDTMFVYTDPSLMDINCEYIRDWDEERLLSLADFNNKVVLDIGSGTGRLAFAAAKKAKRVYASEPGDQMREYMRDKIEREKISNVIVLDGTIETIPFEEDTFDITMSAYVLGVDYEQEISNMYRVTKNGGYIICCMGEDDRKAEGANEKLVKAGFEYSHYVSKNGGDVYRYWKKVVK
jgi:ubiquinone/menaquinone biosynthesis C-methylase UbiE